MRGLRYITKLFGKISSVCHVESTLTIITGANAPYFDSLMTHLLPSIEKYEKNAYVIVWDLGLYPEQKNAVTRYLADKYGRGEVISYPEKDLPAHYSIEAGTYAFKSYCIWKTMCMCQTEQYLWLDAGCEISERLLAERNLMRLYGFYSPYSSTDIISLTHPDVMDAFASRLCHYEHKSMLTGGVVGLSVQSRFAIGLLAQWYNESKVQALLAPEGSNKSNHRQDQSLLSLIYYSRKSRVPLLARKLYNVRIHMNKK